ncbi:hypothetical protein PG984_009974 [Apiospora sp. TS-2023a]
MSLELQPIDPAVDYPALARCLFESYEDPPQRFFHVWFPTHGDGGAEAREAAIAECAARLKLWQDEDSTMHWQKVVDTETGRIAGGALWNIHTENPFDDPSSHQPEVTWFPDDGARRFVEQALEIYNRPKQRAAAKPHLYKRAEYILDLFIIFTHPDYRRRGVGQQIMDWGMKLADEMGFDLFLDSTPHGRSLYEANGFRYIEENLIIPKTDNPDGQWREMEEKVGPFSFWLMWRPVHGIYEGRETQSLPRREFDLRQCWKNGWNDLDEYSINRT